MGQSPFSKRELSQQARANRRRSTRLDYETPVVLSGRDARGQPFHEETVTLIVNFHGAKVRTTHQVLVGMLVTVESVKTGQSAKAVCVNVYEAPSGQTWHGIALQLVQPGNIWGVEDPPADWAAVAAELGTPPKVSEHSPRGPAVSLKSPALAPAPVPAATASQATIDAQLTDLEQRAARLVEGAVETLRTQTDLTVRDALAVYEERLAALVSQAETRVSQRVEQAAAEVAASIETLRSDAMAEMVQDTLGEFQTRVAEISKEHEGRLSEQLERASVPPEAAMEALKQRMTELTTETDRQLTARIDKAFAEFDAALATFRSDLDDELASRREQAVQSAEQALRSRVAAILSTIMSQPQEAPPVTSVDAANKK